MQFQQKNAVPQILVAGVYGSATKNLILEVDQYGRIVRIQNVDSDNQINFPQNPNVFLNGKNEFSSSKSVLGFFMYWQDGRTVLNQKREPVLFQNSN